MKKEKIENWIKDESFKIVYSDPKTIERATSQLLEIFKSEKEKNRQEIIEKIDKIYKKEQGIHNWLDLREKLKEEIKKENYEK